ncbi:hypothetical protein QVD17_25842 [Tagetes erecta]|uniref:Glutamate receptor n=1 Tax=Tagetes erecta TaxID=13708 RepID=A0AAD8K905_TARER|nr:hypothetical protein QVD17_25842 [Tagetes erecta]
MHNFYTYLILSLLVFLLPCFLLQATPLAGSPTTMPKPRNETRIGAILDQTSRPGKETKVAIELAIQDFNNKTDHPLVLYLQNSRNKPVHAAIAAKELIEEHKVGFFIGGHTWEEASAIAQVITDIEPDRDTPFFLSLASTTLRQATDQWPFFIQAVPTQSTQMIAVAAILQSMGIRQVHLLYETSSSASIVSHLSQAFHQTGCVLTHSLPLASGLTSFYEELEVLKRQERKVFIIHTSLELGVSLYHTAKKMNMTGDGYLWIATNGITDGFHSVNSTVISSLKGMIGVKSYFREKTPEFLNFRRRFRLKFRSDFPEEEQDEPGIFALQGYNAIQMIKSSSPEKLHDWKPIPAKTVEIVNVNGKGYNSVYWTEGLGFSETVEDEGANSYSKTMDEIEQILWPVQPWYANRRRRNLIESSDHRLKVCVPTQSLYKQFVNVDPNGTVVDGFVIDVFRQLMTNMNIQSYQLISDDLPYDDLIKQIRSEEDINSTKYDAIAGDVTILKERHEYAVFTQPFTESGLEMIVPVRSKLSNEPWLFLKPFTAKMWWITAGITIYNGFVIWLIERRHNEDLRGPIVTQIGIVLWLAFSTLFALRGDKMHSNLSRMAVVMWLFVALIITQSYTASLASMLTAQRLEPMITSVESLRNTNATVGYCKGEFIRKYLDDVLTFPNISIKSYNSTDEYAEALNSGEIAAIFLEVPAAKLFLAQYCKSFIRSGETFKVGGYGFAFHKNYERFSEANQELLNISESGRLKELEDIYLINEKCVDEESSPDENGQLDLHSYWVLFVLTGGTSTIALVIYLIINLKEFKKSNPQHTSLSGLISTFIKDWKHGII